MLQRHLVEAGELRQSLEDRNTEVGNLQTTLDALTITHTRAKKVSRPAP